MNYIIEQALIDSAQSIRNEFLSLNNKLSNYDKRIAELAKYLQDISSELDTYKDNGIKEAKSVTEITNFILSKMEEIDTESNKVNKLIEPINKAIEKLKIDEQNLYDEIKKRHPNVNDDIIVKEVQTRINKNDT